MGRLDECRRYSDASGIPIRSQLLKRRAFPVYSYMHAIKAARDHSSNFAMRAGSILISRSGKRGYPLTFASVGHLSG